MLSRLENQYFESSLKTPLFEWNNNVIDLLILLNLIFESKTAKFLGSSKSKKSAFKPFLELFGLENVDIYSFESEVKQLQKHKSCVFCEKLTQIYQQIFFDK